MLMNYIFYFLQLVLKNFNSANSTCLYLFLFSSWYVFQMFSFFIKYWLTYVIWDLYLIMYLCNLQNLGSNVRVFESVGRMFLLTDIEDVRKNLKTKIDKSEEKIKTLQVQYLSWLTCSCPIGICEQIFLPSFVLW